MSIDLRSDTVTRPTKGMMDAMMNAEVGDDVFNEDPTVTSLEEKAAALFGKEAGIFCPSGTMTNQIAVKLHTEPGCEVICDRLCHTYNYEGGGIAHNSGASVRLLDGDRGRFTSEDVLNNINPDDVHFPLTSMVSIENTCNKGGGCYWKIKDIEEISNTCKEKGLKLHLDGARIFNALAETNEKPADYGALFDTVSICFSKGLGAPVGSLLLGTKEQIRKARRIRKVLGGGMRQAGFLAAAGIYALDHHINRLADDHRRAKHLGETLKNLPYVKSTLPVDTNIVVFTLIDEIDAGDFISRLAAQKVKVVPFGKQTVRMVTHLDINDEMLERVVQVLQTINVG